jgi:predicted nucleic acid-binding protein
MVSPITIQEIHSAVERRPGKRTLKSSDGKWIEKEFMTDYDFFAVAQWNDEIIIKSLRLIRKYQLRVLNWIQLSTALISKASLFITSDKRLYEAAKIEISNTSVYLGKW